MANLSKTGYLDPWSPIGPDITSFYQSLFPQYQQGPPAPLTPEQQVAPLNPYQQQGMSQLAGWGAGAGGGIQDFLTGQMGAGLNMDQVQQYADNPYMDSMIDAALRDPYRQLTENTLPGMDMGQAATGNTNSVRADMAEGVAQRGYADRAADVAAQMRGGAYGQGLQTALGTRGQDLNYAQLGQDIGLGNIDALLGAGGMGQTQDQRLADAALSNWQYGVEAPWWQAQQYAGLAGPAAESFGTGYGTDQTMDLTDILFGGLAQGASSWLEGLFG